MEINRSAPATAVGHLQIDADPTIVFGVLADLAAWPTWNPGVKAVRVAGPVAPGTVFRWRSGWTPLTSSLQAVDPPRQIAWSGTTMGIKAIHVFRFEPNGAGTLARSEESWDGLLPRLFKRSSRKMLDKTLAKVLTALKAEAERRAAAHGSPLTS